MAMRSSLSHINPLISHPFTIPSLPLPLRALSPHRPRLPLSPPPRPPPPPAAPTNTPNPRRRLTPQHWQRGSGNQCGVPVRRLRLGFMRMPMWCGGRSIGIMRHLMEQDDYEVLRMVGRGKYSEVFAEVRSSDDRKCVVKILKPVKKKKARCSIRSNIWTSWILKLGCMANEFFYHSQLGHEQNFITRGKSTMFVLHQGTLKVQNCLLIYKITTTHIRKEPFFYGHYDQLVKIAKAVDFLEKLLNTIIKKGSLLRKQWHILIFTR
ncbi:Casein kinase II subunit alpha-like protein [Drosera capensis]